MPAGAGGGKVHRDGRRGRIGHGLRLGAADAPPRAGFFDLDQLGEQFTAMPIVLTEYATKPGEDWVPVTSAAIVILLVVVLTFNAGAVFLRNRFERNREG